jgi:predicted GNAT family acetyltransferase
MLQQRQVNVIFRMAGGNVRDRFGPRQRRAFCGAEMGAYPPACQRIQFVCATPDLRSAWLCISRQKAQPLICDTRR